MAEKVIPGKIELNARDLEQELSWFTRVLDARFKLYFATSSPLPSGSTSSRPA